MNFLLTALLLGFVSMMIVFFSGLSSGVVRLTTLAVRSVFAFAMTSAATYFIIMLYDYYEEMKAKKLKKEVKEVANEETPNEDAKEQPPQPEGTFQPMSAENLPNAGK